MNSVEYFKKTNNIFEDQIKDLKENLEDTDSAFKDQKKNLKEILEEAKKTLNTFNFCSEDFETLKNQIKALQEIYAVVENQLLLINNCIKTLKKVSNKIEMKILGFKEDFLNSFAEDFFLERFGGKQKNER